MLERLFYRRDPQVQKLQESVEISFERVKQDTSSVFQYVAQLWRHAAAQERRIAELQNSVERLPSTDAVVSAVERKFDFRGMLDRVRSCERISVETAKVVHDLEDLRSDFQDLSRQVGELHSQRLKQPVFDVEVVKAELRQDALSIRDEVRQESESLRRKFDALTQVQVPILERLRALSVAVERGSVPRVVERVVERKTTQGSERPIRSRLQEVVLKNVARNSKDYIKGMIRGMIAKHGRMSGLQLRDVIVDEQKLTSKSSFYRILEELESDPELAVVVDGKEKVFILSGSAKKSVEN